MHISSLPGLRPESPQPLYYLGVGAMRLRDLDKTVDYLGRYVNEAPKNLVALRMYSDALGAVGTPHTSDPFAHLIPVPSAGSCEMNLSIVGPDPDQLRFGRAGRDGQDVVIFIVASTMRDQEFPSTACLL